MNSRSRMIDLLVGGASLGLVLLAACRPFRGALHLPFFLNEASEACMQFMYYVHALKTGANPLWEHHANLATQYAPHCPLLSPVTVLLVVMGLIPGLGAPETLASLFAVVGYSVQLLMGLSMYAFLRYLSLSRLASLVGAVGYSYCYYSAAFGMYQGFYRASALAMMPLVFLSFWRLFGENRATEPRTGTAALLLGLCFIMNGDVKPTVTFVPVLVGLALVEGWSRHGPRRTLTMLTVVLAVGAMIPASQIGLTVDFLNETVKSAWNVPLPSGDPLHPDNTLLGFSQNPFSLVVGFLLPDAFHAYFHRDADIGISRDNYPEQRFSFGLFLAVMAIVGVLHPLPRHAFWLGCLVLYLLYLICPWTPTWPLFGWLSEVGHVRYPTRSAAVIYFILSIYAACGVDVLRQRSLAGSIGPALDRIRVGSKRVLFIMAAALVLIAVHDRTGILPPWAPRPELVQALAWCLLGTLVAGAVALARSSVFPGAGGLISALGWTATVLLAFLIGVVLLCGVGRGHREFAGLLLRIAGLGVHVDVAIACGALILGLGAVRASPEGEPEGGLGGRMSEAKGPPIAVNPPGSPATLERASRREGWAGRAILDLVVMAGLALFVVSEWRPVEQPHLFTQRRFLELPPRLRDDPTVIFRRDALLGPIFSDPSPGRHRIFLPRPMRSALTTDLGFLRSVHNYCCRQYLDDLRFAFGLDAGPIAMERIAASIRGRYDHPFWRIYNTAYLVDDFDIDPGLLPRDRLSYDRLSPKIVRLRGVRPLAWLTSSYRFVSRERFTREIEVGDPSMLTIAAVHSPPSFSPGCGTDDGEIELADTRSGQLRAQVSARRRALLVFSEVAARSWRATVDGREVPVIPAYGMLQAVEVPPGRHQVVFRYDPVGSPSMRMALAATFLGLVLVLMLQVGGTRTGP